MFKRGCGILMPVFSLPSSEGIGSFGPEAYQFVDMLTSHGVSHWQILPLNSGNPQNGESPYFSVSAFAINPLLISSFFLNEIGLLTASEIGEIQEVSPDNIQYDKIRHWKMPLLIKAAERFVDDEFFEEFSKIQGFWLDDYALFYALHNFFAASWLSWPSALRDRNVREIAEVNRKFQDVIRITKVIQYFAWTQWQNLRRHCTSNGVTVIGDMPIYVSLESADVWSNSRLFKLDQNKRPVTVSGVPPDYFSATGQLWNNPVYNWEIHQRESFSWWTSRMRHLLSLYDVVRIDHFRGLVQFWEIPAGETSAINGSWQDVPTIGFFDTLIQQVVPFPVICEDLGIITDDVRAVIKHYGFPGMKVLQFAFSEDEKNPYLPHNFDNNCFVYTGTHDNLPTLGWLKTVAGERERDNIRQYTKRNSDDFDMVWDLIELALKSDAVIAVFPLQDILTLGEDARVNDPSRVEGNWHWRWNPGISQLEPALSRLQRLMVHYGRTG